MNTQEKTDVIIETLEAMVGHSYNYGRTELRIMNYRIDEARERVYVITDKREYDRDFESFEAFIALFEPIPQRQQLPAANGAGDMTIIAPKLETASAFGELRNVLMDNIRKVQDNKDYVPQATAVLENVNAVIDIAKTEVAYMTAFAKLRNNGDI